MSDPLDPFQSSEWKVYQQHVRDELIPKIRDSAITMSLVPADGVPDPKFAIELGYMIMLDKPIIAVVAPGCSVPPKLALIADEIVEGTLGDPDLADRLNEAIRRINTRT